MTEEKTYVNKKWYLPNPYLLTVLLIPFNKLPCLFTSLGCEANCAPTFDMLSTSQAPSTALFLNFGAGQETADARPESSLCVAN